MQVGDNMLAIYASEKALRLAERLGEVRAASRAHGIFGRVFGRIGDTVKARENLERAIELARDSDENETVLAMLALGHHLENAEGDYGAAEASYARRSRWPSASATFPRRSSCTPRSRSSPSTAATGRRSRARPTPAPSSPNARDWSASCACPTRCAGCLRWRDGDWEAAVELFRRARELAEQVGWSEVAVQRAARARRRAARPRRPRRRRGDDRARRSTCVSAPGWSDSRSRRPRCARSCARSPASTRSRERPPSRPPSWPSAFTTRSAKRPCSRRAA